MLILAVSEKGKEYTYQRANIVRVPSSWSKRNIGLTIDGLNRFFKLEETRTYYPHQIDQYSSVFPAYAVTIRNGNIIIKRT